MFEIASLDLATVTLISLILIAFLSGVGITTIGPGGIFLTIALYALTPLPSGVIAGTVQVAFVLTGVIGTLAYIKSGEISTENHAQILFLCLGSISGALLGSWLNNFVSRDLFGILLGLLAGIVGITILYRHVRSLEPIVEINLTSTSGKVAYTALGVCLGAFSGLLGVGGPVIAVPALVIVGVPMLYAVAIAQVQSIFIAFFAASGYFVQGQISMILAIMIALPLAGGVVLGWKIAHLIEPAKLKLVLALVLIIIAPYLAI